jgi:SAM-dependent methyltransferase
VVRHVRLREVLVGVEGLALMRRLFDDDATAQQRLDEINRILDESEDATYGLGADVPELDVRRGYAAWSTSYDEPGNPLISAEQPVVRAVLDEAPPGDALDAACGTGRHTAHLVERGHRVVGVDGSPEMLARARSAVPGARFEEGDLSQLPLDDDSVDLAVCALAFDHVADVAGPIAELARVVRPGGRVVISDIHPVMSMLGGAAFFRAADGSTAFMRNQRHVHGEYLDAFAAAGLAVRRCLEPRQGPDEVAMQWPAAGFFPEAATDAFLGLPIALVWDLVAS